MKNLLIILMMVSQVGCSGVAKDAVTVDRIEDNNIAVVEVVHNNETKMIDIPQEDFNTPVKEGEKIKHSVTEGVFSKGIYNPCDGETYYQFKSEDDTVWCALTENEIGFIPDTQKTYILIYYDNGTKDCFECEPQYECECEVYDDVTLGVFERR